MLNKKMIFNKKAMSIPIVLLVILTLVLSITTLFYFNIQKKQVIEGIQTSKALDSIKGEQIELDSYLGDIFENSVDNMGSIVDKGKFIESFNGELSNYKDSNGIYLNKWLKQIEGQAEKVAINNSGIILILDVELIAVEKQEDREIIKIRYNYQKTLEKNFEKDL